MTSLTKADIRILMEPGELIEKVSDFLEYLKRIVTIANRQFRQNPFSPPHPFSVLIDTCPYSAFIIDVTNNKGKAANLAVCHAYRNGEWSAFFTLHKGDDHQWTPSNCILPMTWEVFSHLSKAEQYALLGC